MKTLQFMVVRLFLPVFLLALLFFVLILELTDLFTNLWSYLSNDVGTLQILMTSVYYLPKCVSYALPVSLLFSIAFTLGQLYAHNELIAVFGSGVSLFRLVAPLILIGVLISVFGFLFQENVVIDTYREKNQLTQQLLQRKTSFSNTNVTVLSEAGGIIYHADFYNDNSHVLSGLTILKRSADGRFIERIDAPTADWTSGHWQLHRARIIEWNADHSSLIQKDEPIVNDPSLSESPDTFKRTVRNVDEMRIPQALQWINSLKKAGLPFRGELTDFYNRYTFALTPLIVTLISAAIGGRFKKNVLLMSLLVSLVISVIYYVTQMMSVLLAKLGYVSPLTGASAGAILFLIAGVWLLRTART